MINFVFLHGVKVKLIDKSGYCKKQFAIKEVIESIKMFIAAPYSVIAGRLAG
jgi:hypothetical protein